MGKLNKANWQTIVFAAIAALVFMFAANSPAFAQTTYKVGEQIEVLYYGTWTSAKVIEAKDGRYKIRYPIGGDGYDEWLTPDKMRRIGGAAPTPEGGAPATGENNADNQNQEKKSIGEKHGSREPRTCADKKAPARGAITAALATKYVICEREKVSGQYLYLVENVKVEVGGGRPYNPNSDLNVPEINVRLPIYAIRGSLTSYQCQEEDARFNHRAPGKNCAKYNEPEARGDCYKTVFGDWRCYMVDMSNKSENYFPAVAPPKP